MNKSWLLSALSLSFLSSPAFSASNDFNHIYLLQFDYSRARQGSTLETDAAQMLATAYFEEVEHGDLPHSQAYFLERAGSISMGYADLDGEFPFVGSVGGEGSAIDADYVMNTHWVLGGSHARLEFDGLSEQRIHGLRLGRYLSDSSRVLLNYTNTRDESIFVPTARTHTYGIEYKNLTRRLGATALTLDLKLNHVDAPAGSSNVAIALAEYHLNLATSLTAGIELGEGHDESRKYSLGLMQFLTRGFAFGAEFTRLDPETGDHGNTLALHARFLF